MQNFLLGIVAGAVVGVLFFPSFVGVIQKGMRRLNSWLEKTKNRKIA